LFVSNALIFRRVDKVIGINKIAVKKNVVGISIFSLIMGLVVFVLEIGLSQLLPPVGRIASVLHLLTVGSVGVFIYAY
ncbi:polysaccharide biosynthesis protein, partial [Streptococcus pyogenes]